MDPETKNLLRQNLEFTKENNKLLKKIYHVHRWSQTLKIIYWLLFIGISLGAYYFIQPYLNSIKGIYTGGVSVFNNVKQMEENISHLKGVQNVVNEINNRK